jgi:hypothetical protein
LQTGNQFGAARDSGNGIGIFRLPYFSFFWLNSLSLNDNGFTFGLGDLSLNNNGFLFGSAALH